MSPQLKKILPYAAIGAIILATIITVYAAAVLPSKQPYRDGLAQYQKVYTANQAFSQTGTALGSSTATDAQFTENIETSKTALAALDVEVEKLAKVAVLAEGEGKERYDAFAAKYKDYSSYNADILNTILRVRPVVFECNKNTADLTGSTANIEAARTCAQKLEGVSDVANEDYRQLVADLKTVYTKLADTLTAAAALADPDGADKAQAKVYETQREDILDELNTATKTLTQNLQKHRAEVDITETAKALDDYLSKKSKLFAL